MTDLEQAAKTLIKEWHAEAGRVDDLAKKTRLERIAIQGTHSAPCLFELELAERSRTIRKLAQDLQALVGCAQSANGRPLSTVGWPQKYLPRGW